MRDFSSSQIKKGVRSIGFGGDGATWGNYGLVWRDANTALVDYGDTHYTNGNDFHFEAVGLTLPPLWHHLAIYAIAMFQGVNDVRFSIKSPGLGPSQVPVTGKGSDNALFSKIAMPLGKGFSVGILLSYETSQFDATPVGNLNSQQSVRYETEWRPSGGFGVAWQPGKKMLFGFRGLFNNDLERRTDSAGTTQGWLAPTSTGWEVPSRRGKEDGSMPAQPVLSAGTLLLQPTPSSITPTWASNRHCFRGGSLQGSVSMRPPQRQDFRIGSLHSDWTSPM